MDSLKKSLFPQKSLEGQIVLLAPDKDLFKEFGFTVDNVVKKGETLLNIAK